MSCPPRRLFVNRHALYPDKAVRDSADLRHGSHQVPHTSPCSHSEAKVFSVQREQPKTYQAVMDLKSFSV